MGIINIKNLSFKYGDNKVFNHLYLNIKKGSYTTIIGNNKSGKTTLGKLLMGFEKTKGIYTNSKIGIVFEDPSVFFIEDTVLKEILSFTNNDIKEIIELLNIGNILYKNPMLLNKKNQYLVSLACALAGECDVIILDCVYIDKKIIKKLKEKGKTIILLTRNPEDILESDFVIFINKGKNVFSGSINKLLNNLDVFDKCNISMPFILDLSNKLMFYNLIDKNYIDMEKLVKDIWKI